MRKCQTIFETKRNVLERTSNAAAQALYRRFGFAPVGVRKNYYEGVEDAIVMWCHDIDSTEYAERLDRLEAGLVG